MPPLATEIQIPPQLHAAKRSFFEDLASTRCDPKKFWATARKFKPRSSTISNALHNESSTATSDCDKANMLNEFFASCFNPAVVPPSYPHPEALDNICPDSYDIVSNEVANLLKKTKPHSASGPDGIST